MAFGDATYLTDTDYQQVLQLISATGHNLRVSDIVGSIHERTAHMDILDSFDEGATDAQSILDTIAAGQCGTTPAEQERNRILLRDAFIYRMASHLVQVGPRLSSQESAGLSQEWAPADLDELRADLLARSNGNLKRLPKVDPGATTTVHKIIFTRGGPDVC